MEIKLSTRFLEWFPEEESDSVFEVKPNWDEPYKILKNAEENILLCESKKINNIEYDIHSILVALKRAASIRIDDINATCNVKSPVISKDKESTIEALLKIGIIRPLMWDKLRELRNSIEHGHYRTKKEKIIPGIDGCKEIAEYIWYFLRATDYLSRKGVCNITFGGGGQFVELNGKAKTNWSFSIEASVRLDMIEIDDEDFMLINATHIEELDDKISISGAVNYGDKTLMSILRLYLTY